MPELRIETSPYDKGVPVKKTSPLAKLPVYGSSGAAAADVCGINETRIITNPGCSVAIDNGLQFQVPPGYELKVYSRSGHGFKSGIRLANCTGILDSDYRGNLMVKLHNDSDTVCIVEPFERVCQVQVRPAPRYAFVEVEELDSTIRGEAGFGSTGKV